MHVMAVCIFTDSWIHSIDDKENKQPLKQRPMLTDPSDVFGDSNSLTDDKTSNPDEVDSYIEENLDIPEINNEVNTVKSAHVGTSIKGSPVLCSLFLGPLNPK